MQARPKAHSSCRICTCSRRRPRRKTAVAGCLRGWTRKSPAAASSIASSFCARSRSTFSATSPMRTRNRASATCMALVARSQGTVSRAARSFPCSFVLTNRLGSASMQKEQQRQREEELGREQKRVGVILLLLSRILANLPDSRLALRVCPPIHCLLACSFSPH